MERIALQVHSEVSVVAEINDEWDEGLDKSKENILILAQTMGVVSEDTAQIR